MLQIRGILLVLICFLSSGISAQVRVLHTNAVSDTIRIDSVVISGFSLKVYAGSVLLQNGNDYTLHDGNRKLHLREPARWDSLHIYYQRFPDWLVAEKYNRKPVIYTDETGGKAFARNTDNPGQQSNGNEVQTDGVLLRGISFGSTQDLVLNSSLNLRINGKISPTVSIEGAVTDQEFPFQPEGTTSSLQDFDRVYIMLKMPRIRVLMGDHPFVSPGGVLFMKYAKKDRGLDISGLDTLRSGAKLNWEFSAGLARGRFNRNEINGQEGLQGPYRLQGARGEQFIIIVSGTEVVYLDGKKMSRGLQADYIIDYNSGEITFTPKHIINAYSRIVVEFQYSDRAYTRSVTGANVNLQQKKMSYTLAVFSEQDAKNQPIQQDLTAYDSLSGMTARQVLEQSGDNVSAAVFTAIHKNTVFNSSVPNYIRRDSGSVVFYQYIAAPDTNQFYYTLTFSYVGPGKGHYVLRGTVANGKAYRYVGEVSGIPSGDYEPVTQLRAPSRISLAEAGTKYQVRKGTEITVNAAVSSQDKNTFSAAGDADNTGGAFHIAARDLQKIGRKDSGGWYLKSTLDLEQTTKNFSTIERYRDVEFGRMWNRNLYNPENGTDPQNSRYGRAGLELGKGKVFAFFINGGANETGAAKAFTGMSGIQYQFRNFYFKPGTEISSAKNAGVFENDFYKNQAELGYKRKRTELNYLAQRERSSFQNSNQELQSQSYGFLMQTARIQLTDARFEAGLQLSDRLSEDLKFKAFSQSVRVQNAGLDLQANSKNAGVFKMGLGYRKMELLDTFFRTKYATENHFAGRMEYNVSRLFKLITGNIYFQTQNGREQQRQYTYFEVPAGQGYFAWIDFNGDGVQQVNEFQETPFRDQARYVRLLVPTGTYLKAQTTDFNGNLLFAPGMQKPDRKVKFNNRTTWTYTGKTTLSDWGRRVFPFALNSANSGLLAMSSFVRNLAEAEWLQGKLMTQYTAQNRGSKTFFTAGFDTRKILSHSFLFRFQPGDRWQVKNTLEWKKSRYQSEAIPLNSFEYIYNGVEPSVTWQPGSKFRFTINGRVTQSVSESETIAKLKEWGLQVTRSLGKGGILDARVSTLQADYRKPNGTPLSYDVLQGFSPGRNFRGITDLRFSAAGNIQILLSYEGRKTGDAKFVHIGRAEARYLF